MQPGPDPPPEPDDDDPVLAAANARAGLWLFGVYLALYGGFVGLNAFDPALMAGNPFGGMNLALLYGLGLIAMAFVLAMVYMALCRRISDQRKDAREGRGR